MRTTPTLARSAIGGNGTPVQPPYRRRTFPGPPALGAAPVGMPVSPRGHRRLGHPKTRRRDRSEVLPLSSSGEHSRYRFASHVGAHQEPTGCGQVWWLLKLTDWSNSYERHRTRDSRSQRSPAGSSTPPASPIPETRWLIPMSGSDRVAGRSARRSACSPLAWTHQKERPPICGARCCARTC